MSNEENEIDYGCVCLVCCAPETGLSPELLFLSGVAFGMLFNDKYINESLCEEHKKELEFRNMSSIGSIHIDNLRAK